MNKEVVQDIYQGVKFSWSIRKIVDQNQPISLYPRRTDEKRYYQLTFDKKHHDLITGCYLKHVLQEGKATDFRNRQRKLYTNGASCPDGCKRSKWSYVVFEHLATFDTLAMDPKKKGEIMDDLIRFSKAKEYYARIGRDLLYGPHGTGKSTMIASIANFLRYGIYDLVLTEVKSNTDLTKLLIETTSKSIIVVEDINCSLNLTGQRKEKAKHVEGEDTNSLVAVEKGEEENGNVTLCGLLNFIDGIWSASGGQRLIIFTTNYVEKLDKALTRKGRMDMHNEMAHCDFEGFKLLVKNYLEVDSHHLFDIICRLLKENKMTPADVAENLMPKSIDEDTETSLRRLVQALQNVKAGKKLTDDKGKNLNAGIESRIESASE